MPRGKVIAGWRPQPPPYASVIGALLSTTNLSSNERKFLEDVRHALHMTEKQHRYLHLLINRATRSEPQHRRRHRGIADDLDDEIVW
jgi:hypothetical protein